LQLHLRLLLLFDLIYNRLVILHCLLDFIPSLFDLLHDAVELVLKRVDVLGVLGETEFVLF
jgi:hypothetical protein